MSAAASVVGILIAILLASLFRLRLGRWPPLLRTAAAAVAIASLGIDALYAAAAAASSSGQLCTDCPSEAGWTISLLSAIIMSGAILTYRLHKIRLALDTNVALRAIAAYAVVALLACLDGDLIVWLPWIETPATLALAGFPDDTSISFTTWSILLCKVPFLAFAASNATRSGNISTTDFFTLIMTGASLAISLSIKYLRQIAFANMGLDVLIGVRDDASMAASLMTPSGFQGSRGDDVSLNDLRDVNEARPVANATDTYGSSRSDADGVSRGGPGYVGIPPPQKSSIGRIQTGASAAIGIGLVALIVTAKVPSFATVVEICKYLFAAICVVLGLGIVAMSVKYAYTVIIEGRCSRKTVRMSLFEALKGDLEAAEMKVREVFEAAEEGRKRQEYIVNYVHNEFGMDPEELLPFEEVTARIGAIMSRLEAGTASEDDESELARLISMLDANPEAKQRYEEARKAFLAEQAPANASATRRLRSFFPPNARLLPSITALETAGVGTSVARRLLRNNALVLVLTPPEEVSTMHWVDLRRCSSLGLSLFELRAVVASLPDKFAVDTAKGEKREWAKGFVETLRSMVEKEAKGELQPNDLCYPCFATTEAGAGEGGSPYVGPFNPALPLTRRPTAVQSEPTSGAAETQVAATLLAKGSVAKRTAVAAARGGDEPSNNCSAAAVKSTRHLKLLREQSTSGSISSTNKKGSNKDVLAEIVAAAAARRSDL